MPEIKCGECRWAEQHAFKSCSHPEGQFYSCHNERKEGACGPDAKLFEAKAE